MKWLLPVFILFFFSLPACQQASKNDTPKNNWTTLFNGSNIDSWEVRNGTAEFSIEGNELVGTSKMNTPNTFLCTKKNYDNFILELELKVDEPLNSGIQIRSNSIADYRDGVVHGYQVEVDPSPRAFSGGIYDEQRRGWIYPLCENHAGRKGFKNGQWNNYRIEAIGSAIRVWVNDIQTANLRDDVTATGFIGLQVHSIGKDSSMIGKTVRWRNIKIMTENLEAEKRKDSKAAEINLVANELSNWEKENGYKLLESMSTEKTYKNFDLKFQFKFPENAEGGVQYGKNIFQIINDKNIAQKDITDVDSETYALASLLENVAAKNICVEGRHKDFRGFDNWNTGRIIFQNGKIEHWMNDYKMVDTQMEADDAEKAISFIKGNGVEFRSIKIKEL